MPLRDFEALQESIEARTPVAAFRTSEAMQVAKSHALETHEQELLKDNLRFEHQRVVVKAEKECHQAQGGNSNNRVAHKKVLHENTK